MACYGRDDFLMAAVENGEDITHVDGMICEMLDLPRPAVKVVAMKELPRTPNGKLDYKTLAEVEREHKVAVTG